MKRTQAEEKIRAFGASAKPSVVKGLSFLVTNDPESGSSENKKANSLGISIIDEERFLAILADPGKAGEMQGTEEIVQDADKPKPKSKPKKSGSAKTQGELGNVLNP